MDSAGPLIDRRLVIVTGKGGTGKTTAATALALAGAASGQRTAICDLTIPSRLPAWLAPGTGPRPRPVPGVTGLSALAIHPDTALREWAGRLVGRPAAALLTRAPAVLALVAAAPGARELIVLGKAWDLTVAGPGRRHRAAPYDLVVVDAPSSGHVLGLLQAPGTYARIGPRGPVGHQAHALRDALRDPDRAAVVAVTTPADLPVAETLELDGRVRAVLGRGLDVVVVNRVVEPRFDDDEARRVVAATAVGPPALARVGRAVSLRRIQERDQAVQLARLTAGVTAPRVALPLRYVPALSRGDLHELGRPFAVAPVVVRAPTNR